MTNEITSAYPDPSSVKEAVAQAAGNNFRLDYLEGAIIARAIEHTGGNMRKASRLLGIGKTTLYRRMAEFKIERTSSGPIPVLEG